MHASIRVNLTLKMKIFYFLSVLHIKFIQYLISTTLKLIVIMKNLTVNMK